MSISAVGSSSVLPLGVVTVAGQVPDPQVAQAQVSAQADLLQALRGTELPMKMIAASLSDGQGVDLYM